MKTTLMNILGACTGTARDKRNNVRVSLWTFVWVLSWVLLLAALEFEWITSKTLITALTAATIAPAIGMVTAYRRFLREADELQRKIELDALAAAFGVGVVGGMTFFLLAEGGVVGTADYLWVIFAMFMTHPLAVWIGHRRYA